MDFVFKVPTDDNACDSSNEENEYHMEIEFTSLKFRDEIVKNIQVIFLYGDLMNKIDVHQKTPNDNGDEENNDDRNENRKSNDFILEKISYVIHSTPSRFAERLLDMPIIFLFMTDDDKMIGNPITLEVNECFANSVRSNHFIAELLRKTYDITDDTKCLGKVSINLSIHKEIGDSNRFRKFYTESTAERLKLEKI